MLLSDILYNYLDFFQNVFLASSKFICSNHNYILQRMTTVWLYYGCKTSWINVMFLVSYTHIIVSETQKNKGNNGNQRHANMTIVHLTGWVTYPPWGWMGLSIGTTIGEKGYSIKSLSGAVERCEREKSNKAWNNWTCHYLLNTEQKSISFCTKTLELDHLQNKQLLDSSTNITQKV